MSIKTEIRSNMYAAMKANNKDNKQVYAMMLDNIQKAEKTALREFNDNEVIPLIQKQIKQCKETLEYAEKAKNEIPAPADEEKTVFTQKDLCQFDDFEKIQLVVAKVLKCEKVPKADKLLKSVLKVGDTERVVVSGIAKFYSPEEMVGKKVVLLANLAPRKFRGVESHGMLRCAANADDSKLSLLTVDSDMEDGCEIG